MDTADAGGDRQAALLAETIGDCLTRVAQRFADRDALVEVARDRRWTYAQFDADVSQLARALLSCGIEKGERVGIWAPNCSEWLLLQYATARIGAILVCINPAYRSHELRFVLQHAGVSLLVAARTNRGADYRQMVAAVRGELPALRQVVYIGDASWDALLHQGETVTAQALVERARTLSCRDPINIQYTSGTTGAPKGATLTHHNILNNGYFVGEGVRYSEQDRICVPVPFYHCFGMVMGSLAAVSHGAALVIPADNFDPLATLRAVVAQRCTALYGVPTVFIAMLAEPACAQLDFRSLRTGIMAGAPCPVAVMREVMERLNMREVAICYGMTETSPVSTMTRVDDSLQRRTETVGRAMPHLQVQIVSPGSRQPVPAGSTGEVCTRGYSVMQGYWQQPDKTREAIDADGWMHTGDLGVMDEAGYLRIVGRIKDMVIRGGENIYPREIEEFLYEHPDIIDAQVIGVPDARYGEELMACLRLREGAVPPTAASLRAFCEGRLARYKIPRYVRVMEAFPMTVTGKIRKVELREQALAWLAEQAALAASPAGAVTPCA